NVDVVTDSLRLDDQIAVEREGARVIFSRDGRGRLKVFVEGDMPRSELERIGQDLAGLVVQQYIHRRLSEEFERRGFVMLEEEREPDQTIRLHVRLYRD
ncbi:MAG: hypothetical protein NTX50_24585, partial [Candidatus Sumerlaeota bacterium]|nr:hypothetical protein [Candidatus Sumerlaeota bacterium]